VNRPLINHSGTYMFPERSMATPCALLNFPGGNALSVGIDRVRLPSVSNMGIVASAWWHAITSPEAATITP
jgi:hypothetical protein